jgi:CRP-like cAMP-binding protein
MNGVPLAQVQRPPNSAPEARPVASLDLFRVLAPAAMEDVVSSARVRFIPRGTCIFDQGEPVERAHALLAGSLRISQAGSDGEQVVIRFIGPGEIFGSVAIYTDGHYPADAVAMTDAIEVSWAHGELISLMEQHSRIAINMVAIIGKRLGELQERVRELATQRAERRIANTLLRLVRQTGHATAAGQEIGFPLRRKDIADISGTTLYTVSRTLTQWGRNGWVSSDNRQLTLRAMAEIEGIAQE